MKRVVLAGIALLVAVAVQAEPAPDLASALALRELEPVRGWLAERAEATDAATWRMRIAVARLDAPDRLAELLAEAQAAHPDDAALLLQQAAFDRTRLDEDDGRFERMREARAIGRLIDRALTLDPDEPEALAAAIGFHRDVPRIAGGREERVGPLMDRLETVAPARAAHFRFVDAERAGRLNDAAEALEQAVASDPLGRPAWQVQRAALAGRMGQVSAAVDGLEGLVRRFPNYAPGWYELGRWIAEGDQPAARGIEALEHYLLMDRWPGDPSTARALVALATLKHRAGDPAGARRALEQARILEPGIDERESLDTP